MNKQTTLTWYKVEDVLPVSDDKVLCCTRTQKGVLNMVLGYYANGRWCCGMNSNVIAWASLIPVYADLAALILRNLEAEA